MTKAPKKTRTYPITGRYLGPRSDRFLASAAQLHAAYAAGTIRNPDFNDLKSTLSRCIYDAYRALKDSHRKGMRSARTGSDRWSPDHDLFNDLGYSTPGNTHDLIAFRKKMKGQFAPLATSKTYGPAMRQFQDLTEELYPIAEMLAYLKNKRVMGRAPRKEPPPANPDQVTGYCAVCFSRQAVRAGHMVHHGYMRPGTGHQTISCSGISYPPYERSDEGCRASLTRHQTLLASNKAELRNKENWTVLYEIKEVREGISFRSEMIKHTPDSADWERLKSNRIDKIEQEITYHAERITFYETKIAEWALTALRCADGRILPLDYDGTKIPPRTEKRAK